MYDDILEFKGTWRIYQQRVLDKFAGYSQDHKIHVVAAPGSGKTTLGIELIKRTNRITLILTPTITKRILSPRLKLSQQSDFRLYPDMEFLFHFLLDMTDQCYHICRRCLPCIDNKTTVLLRYNRIADTKAF